MLNFIAQAGYAATSINFTSDFSLLLTGLIGITWFAAGMIIVQAVRYHFSQKAMTGVDTVPTEVEYRKAA